MSLLLVCLCLVLGFSYLLQAGEYLHEEFPPPVYEQQLTFVFDCEESAQQATFEICPLFEGYERVVTGRWDDNAPTGLTAAELQRERGLKATYYLNSPATSYAGSSGFVEEARKLLALGNSIGGHTLSHPYLTCVSRNRAFEELLAVRIEWEATLDTLVNSHTFSYIDYYSQAEGFVVQADLVRLLQRAGYNHVAEFINFFQSLPSDLAGSVIMPPENTPYEEFKQAVEWALGDLDLREGDPAISNSMHAWYGTKLLNYDWDELARRLDLLASIPNAWRCNQNEYAAYWYQQRRARLTTEQAGSTVIVRLTRPIGVFVNGDMPLTLAVHCEHNALQDFSSPDAELALASRQPFPDSLLVNVPPSRDQLAPVRIGVVKNPSNSSELTEACQDADFPGLLALLYFEAGELVLQVENHTGQPLEGGLVTFRLPLAWQEGIHLAKLPRLGEGEGWTERFRPTEASLDAKYRYGAAYLVAQLDFNLKDTPGRLYATTQLSFLEDQAFPKGRFAVLGPLPAEAAVAELIAQVEAEGLPCEVAGVTWRLAPTDGPVPDGYLDCELIRTQGDWSKLTSSPYLLSTVINSPEPQPVHFQVNPEDVQALWLNGDRLEGFTGALKQGENSLALLYHSTAAYGAARHTGCFLRAVEPVTQKRLTTITYMLPQLPSD